MAKQLMFDETARANLKDGLSQLAAAVKVTLGPTGKNVILQKSWGSPKVTKDGVSVSKEIELPEPFKNMGAKMVNQVASKTSDEVGDGTTTSTVLAEAIYTEGLKYVIAGANPMALKRGIDEAVSAAVEELKAQARDVLEGKDPEAEVYPHPIAFNCLPHIDVFMENGYTKEEMKMVNETRKIFADPDIRVAPTCMRVPVMRAHCEAINLTFSEPISERRVREILAQAPGVRLVDDRERNYFPMPIDATGADEVLVGRIRQDISQPDGRGIDLFVAGDQLRKGAALDAVQIAERVLELARDPEVTSTEVRAIPTETPDAVSYTHLTLPTN